MDALLSASDEFAGFGRFALMPRRRLAERRVLTSPEPAATRRALRKEIPRRPGVYGMLDRDGRLIYVGKAKSLCHRLLSYFTGQDEDSKSLMIGQRARTVVWEPAPSELAALLRELELIRRWRPVLNVRSQPGRVQPMYVCVGREPAPAVFLAANPPGGRTKAYGPVRATRRVREAILQLNLMFQLRDCPQSQKMSFADQRQLFDTSIRAGCLRWELGTCLGPCAGGCTRNEYANRVHAARQFLEGRNYQAIVNLRESMRQAAENRAYERATALRDMADEVEWFSAHLHRLRKVQATYNFVHRAQSSGRREHWYFVRDGIVRLILPRPRIERERSFALQSITRVFGPRAEMATLQHEDVEHSLLLAQWFSRRADELKRAWSPDEAVRQLRNLAIEPVCAKPPALPELLAASGYENRLDLGVAPPASAQ